MLTGTFRRVRYSKGRGLPIYARPQVWLGGRVATQPDSDEAYLNTKWIAHLLSPVLAYLYVRKNKAVNRRGSLER